MIGESREDGRNAKIDQMRIGANDAMHLTLSRLCMVGIFLFAQNLRNLRNLRINLPGIGKLIGESGEEGRNAKIEQMRTNANTPNTKCGIITCNAS